MYSAVTVTENGKYHVSEIVKGLFRVPLIT